MKRIVLLAVLFALVAVSLAGMTSTIVCQYDYDPCFCSRSPFSNDGIAWTDCGFDFVESQRIPAGETIDLGSLRSSYYWDGFEYEVIDKHHKVVYTTGNQFIEFTNLIYDVEYQFSTCSREFLSYDTKFDTVLVLRDAFGNPITSNDDCAMDNSYHQCSYVSYRHLSYEWNTVYLSIYTAMTYGDCDNSLSDRMGVPVFYSLVDEIAYGEYLQCYDYTHNWMSSYNYPSADTDLLYQLIDYYLYDYNVLEFSVDGGRTFLTVNYDWYNYVFTNIVDNCDSLGDNHILFKIYGDVCESVLTIKQIPVDMVSFEYTQSYLWVAVLNPLVIKTCSYGQDPCPIDFDQQYLIPPVYVFWEDQGAGCGFPEDLHFDVGIYNIGHYNGSPDYKRIATLGDSIDYFIDGYDGYGNYFGTVPTSTQINGLQILEIVDTYSYERIQTDGELVIGREYDLTFRLYFSDTVYFSSNALILRLYNGGPLNDPYSFYEPATYSVPFDISSISAGMYVDTITGITFDRDETSNNYIPPGSYTVVLFADYWDSFDESYDYDGYAQTYFPSGQRDTNISLNWNVFPGKRGAYPLYYFVSIANPVIHLRYDVYN